MCIYISIFYRLIWEYTLCGILSSAYYYVSFSLLLVFSDCFVFCLSSYFYFALFRIARADLLGKGFPLAVIVVHAVLDACSCEPRHDKPTKCVCAQRRLRSAWASAQSDQSLRCPHEESLGT